MNEYEIVPAGFGSLVKISAVKGGRLPQKLSGTFTKEILAEQAIRLYKNSKPEKKDYTPESTPLIELDKLTKKDMLLEFASIFKIEVPESMKQPASIKKFIKEELELREA